MIDVGLRELERQANAGDADARRRLRRAKARTQSYGSIWDDQIMALALACYDFKSELEPSWTRRYLRGLFPKGSQVRRTCGTARFSPYPNPLDRLRTQQGGTQSCPERETPGGRWTPFIPFINTCLLADPTQNRPRV